jgi:hypothetical protein
MSDHDQLTNICKSLQNMQKQRIGQNPHLDAYYTTTNQESILGKMVFCSDVLFVRSFYDDLFKLIRSYWRVILLGNPGISKSV